jgi:hypothetical protein
MSMSSTDFVVTGASEEHIDALVPLMHELGGINSFEEFSF